MKSQKCENPLYRSQMMSKIRSKDTYIELIARKYLFSRGFIYRKNVRTLPGTPDIVLKKYNTVIFINGCFWHHHQGCKRAGIPKTNIEYWQNKISKNTKNGQNINSQLISMGWKVIVIWECELSKLRFDDTMKRIVN